MSSPVDASNPADSGARSQPAPPDNSVGGNSVGGNTLAGLPARASAREVAAAICPYLASAGGSWRMASPSREHRCRGLLPPAPQTTEKQRQHCLSPEHVDCAIYRAARDARQTALAAGFAVDRVVAADEARRPLPRTSPILLEPPRLLDQAARLQLDRAPGQLALVVLMVVAFAIVALSRLSASPGPASPSPSAPAVAPSIAPRTPPPTPIVLPSDTASLEPSGSLGPSFRTTYTVMKGDTLVGVANKFKTTAAAIRQLNNLTSSTLHVGQVLKIP